MWWLILSALAFALSYYWLHRPFKYWKNQGVQQTNPWVFIGDSWSFISRIEPVSAFAKNLYNTNPNVRYFGFYQFQVPTLLLRDPDLINQITVKDFDQFVDHRSFIPEGGDPLWTNNLFALKGQKWKDTRATLTPAFTSSKMKFMFGLITKNGERFAKYFLEKDQDLVEVQMKEVITRFTNDVIANAAFGVDIDSLVDPDNEFYIMGKEVSNLSSFSTIWKMMATLLAPSIVAYFKVRIFSQRVNDFFTTLVTSNIESREKNGIVRPDMIQLLLEAKKNALKQEEAHHEFATAQESEVWKNLKHKRGVTEQGMVSHTMVFFFAGFDSVSNIMCFMCYELAINNEIHERLTREVDETWKSCSGNITYEALFEMKYLDMVVNETLRKWPVASFLDRTCTKAYTIEPKYPDEKPVHVKKNHAIWMSVLGIHRDPKYYPEPEKFDPERFSDENKGNIKPYTYLPFGSGPRACIGSRFALLEIKVFFIHLLRHFQVVPVAKTQIPLVINKQNFNMTAEDGFQLGLKRR